MSFVLGKIFDAFVQERPVAVMARGTIENIFNSDRINKLFEDTAETQYTRELTFSSLVELMSQVVLGVHPSVHAAYQAQAEKLGVSDQAVYDKLNGVETAVSTQLVRDSAQQAIRVIRSLRATLPPLLKGYRTRILDGNHLSASEHRIEELRSTGAAPLPGQALVVLDQEWMLASDIFLCEDGHAQERSLLEDVLSSVGSGELWIADRNFCTIDFLGGIASRGSRFIIRQHGLLEGTLIGTRVAKGETDTGKVYEQKLRITKAHREDLTVRRITVVLRRATRDGDRQIHLLTNLPVKDASAAKVACLYSQRWTIETVFQQLTETLKCEVNTLGYPKAALFGFCLALMAYHVVSIIKAALRAVHGQETVDKKISGYYLSLEISQAYDGMMVAIAPRHWTRFDKLTPAEMARVLKKLAGNINLRRYKKHPRGPKKPPPKKKKCKGGSHVSTAKILAKRT